MYRLAMATPSTTRRSDHPRRMVAVDLFAFR
ncbi:hypothetical protein HALLA_20600 (plasmid) [Halostagnicola larsenii XH-48]|uniref:Uncharacterized protein n=1 Tax=Halostagnicola larsenii XH-48 TaxID=797299 RepID=W0JYP5_9EURY|nr:hypothetical protein HALLA_20600 [Halostagnicola larsenii XH-48]